MKVAIRCQAFRPSLTEEPMVTYAAALGNAKVRLAVATLARVGRVLVQSACKKGSEEEKLGLARVERQRVLLAGPFARAMSALRRGRSREATERTWKVSRMSATLVSGEARMAASCVA
jgi:hypothetical protein